MDRSLFLDELRAARAEWEAALAEIPSERMTEPGLAGGWSVKDLIAHVAWSEREMIGVIRDHLFRIRDAGDRLFELVGTIAHGVDRQVYSSEAGRFHIGQCLRGQTRFGRVWLEATGPAERVDHDRFGIGLFGEGAFGCSSSRDRGGGECRGHRRRQEFASIEHDCFSLESPGPANRRRGRTPT